MRKYKKTTVGIALLLLLFLASYLYPLYGPMDFNKRILVSDEEGNVLGRAPFPSSFEHIMGTDRNGQDMHLLMLYGAKYTLVTALVVALMRVLFGGAMGVFLSIYAPYLKKYFKDFFVIFRYIPTIFLGIVLMLPVHGSFESPMSSVVTYQILMLVFLGFPSVTIFASEITDELVRTSFVKSSYLMGASRFHIIRRHLMPYFRSYGVLFTFQQLLSALQITMHLGIFSFFLGGQTIGGTFGYEEPPKAASLTNEWAGLIGQNFHDFMRAPWMIFAPILGFFIVILIVNMMRKELEEQMNGTLVLNKKKKDAFISSPIQPEKHLFVFVKKEQQPHGFSEVVGKGSRKTFLNRKGLIWGIVVIFICVVTIYEPGGKAKIPEAASANKKSATTKPVVSTSPLAQETSTPVKQEPHAVGEEIKLTDSTLTVTKVEKSKGTPEEKPKPGNEFYIITVEMKNTGKEKVRFAPHFFNVVDSKGNMYMQPFLMIDIDTTLSSGELDPGTSVTGTLAYELPISGQFQLEYVPYQQVNGPIINLQ
ncbi:DUF4352 domain-containing protein [Neobacillus drentensis]|jgi:peptide/nickel transport system permease protein|uniref:DUF4352 domain-containing protein n=1 Tax=Neobacillus drentensis TaxID=220684 RepID=UPI002FFE3895